MTSNKEVRRSVLCISTRILSAAHVVYWSKPILGILTSFSITNGKKEEKLQKERKIHEKTKKGLPALRCYS